MQENRARLVRSGLVSSIGVLIALLLPICVLTGYSVAAGQAIFVELGIIGVRTVHFSGSNMPLRTGLTSLPGQTQCPAPRLTVDIGDAEISLLAWL